MLGLFGGMAGMCLRLPSLMSTKGRGVLSISDPYMYVLLTRASASSCRMITATGGHMSRPPQEEHSRL